MKVIKCLQLCLSSVIVLLLFSCDEKPKNPLPKYGDALTNAYKGSVKLGEAANLAEIKKAIETYRATNDKYPQSIDEVRNLINTPIDFSLYDYNPETGDVSLKK